MSAVIHTLHVLVAGTWLGGVIFTTVVVSPTLKAMTWSEAERVRVRSVIGKQYAKVGTINLVLLLVFAVLDGVLQSFGPVFYVEYGLLIALFALVAAQGVYFGRRLANLAKAETGASTAGQARYFAQQRRRFQKVSFGVSVLNLVTSVALVVLAINV